MRKKELNAVKKELNAMRLNVGNVFLNDKYESAFRLVVNPYEQSPKTLSEALSDKRPPDYITYLGSWYIFARAEHASLESGGVHKVPKDYNGPYKRYDLTDNFDKLTCRRYFYIDEHEIFIEPIYIEGISVHYKALGQKKMQRYDPIIGMMADWYCKYLESLII